MAETACPMNVCISALICAERTAFRAPSMISLETNSVELTPRPVRLLVEATTVAKTEEPPAFKAGIGVAMAGFPPDLRKTPKGEDVPVEPLRRSTDKPSTGVLGKEENATKGPRLDSVGIEVERRGGISLVSIPTDSE